ncbi:MAG: 1-aminocyclopropane-1-carboxylate deaminase/D-cysteine desulfhydrase, partial [Gemmataceae bacterium]
MTRDELLTKLSHIPRAKLAHLPTPLEFLPRFTNALGGDVSIWIKRDDCTGLLLGGNKARHNEFLLGDALAQKAEIVVWGAGVQSNNCRQTAAGCAKLGLECHLYLSRGHYSTEPQGNLLLDYLVGAKVEFVDATIGPELDALLAAKAEELRRARRRVYCWHRPRVVPLAALSYVDAIQELAGQLAERDLCPKAVYVSSAGATGAGVALGVHLLNLPWQARLISPMPWPWDTAAALAEDANAAAKMLGITTNLTREQIDLDERFIPPGYGKPSDPGQEALHLLARTEGILLDPVYSAKAMAGLMSDVRTGRYAPGSTIVFIHTGGVPAIFAQPQQALARGEL